MKFSKKIFKIFLVLVVAVLIELLYFNYSTLKLYINKDIKTDLEYGFGDIIMNGWIVNPDGSYTTDLGPISVVENINTYVENVVIIPEGDDFNSNGIVFYLNDNYKELSEDAKIVVNDNFSDENIIKIGDYVTTLRVDFIIGEGVKLNNLKIICNKTNFDFRISRIVTILLVYLAGSFLLKLQEPRKYEI